MEISVLIHHETDFLLPLYQAEFFSYLGFDEHTISRRDVVVSKCSDFVPGIGILIMQRFAISFNNFSLFQLIILDNR